MLGALALSVPLLVVFVWSSSASEGRWDDPLGAPALLEGFR